jgi:hypothetical protein
MISISCQQLSGHEQACHQIARHQAQPSQTDDSSGKLLQSQRQMAVELEQSYQVNLADSQDSPGQQLRCGLAESAGEPSSASQTRGQVPKQGFYRDHDCVIFRLDVSDFPTLCFSLLGQVSAPLTSYLSTSFLPLFKRTRISLC